MTINHGLCRMVPVKWDHNRHQRIIWQSVCRSNVEEDRNMVFNVCTLLYPALVFSNRGGGGYAVANVQLKFYVPVWCIQVEFGKAICALVHEFYEFLLYCKPLIWLKGNLYFQKRLWQNKRQKINRNIKCK